MQQIYPDVDICRMGVDLWFERADFQLLQEGYLHSKIELPKSKQYVSETHKSVVRYDPLQL